MRQRLLGFRACSPIPREPRRGHLVAGEGGAHFSSFLFHPGGKKAFGHGTLLLFSPQISGRWGRRVKGGRGWHPGHLTASYRYSHVEGFERLDSVHLLIPDTHTHTHTQTHRRAHTTTPQTRSSLRTDRDWRKAQALFFLLTNHLTFFPFLFPFRAVACRQILVTRRADSEGVTETVRRTASRHHTTPRHG